MGLMAARGVRQLPKLLWSAGTVPWPCTVTAVCLTWRGRFSARLPLSTTGRDGRMRHGDDAGFATEPQSHSDLHVCNKPERERTAVTPSASGRARAAAGLFATTDDQQRGDQDRQQQSKVFKPSQ
jgi:hypothetical protein